MAVLLVAVDRYEWKRDVTLQVMCPEDMGLHHMKVRHSAAAAAEWLGAERHWFESSNVRVSASTLNA